MSLDAFKIALAEILRVDASALRPELALTDDNFDSLALLSTIAAIDENFRVGVSVEQLTSCKNVSELLALASAAQAK